MPPLLRLVLDKLSKQEILNPFVILYGPWVDLQWQTVREISQKASGFFVWQDILELKDFSKELAKNHTLKVEKKDNPEDKLLSKDFAYNNLGAREINDWLSYAPSWDLKIVLIEHLERATLWAANALLKSFEEPLPHRLIIASLLNKDSILQTILSRALLIYCDSEYHAPSLDTEQQSLFEAITKSFSDGNMSIITKWSASIKKEGRERDFLYNLIAYFDHQQDYKKLALTIDAYRKLSSNVLSEHVLFQLFVRLLT